MRKIMFMFLILLTVSLVSAECDEYFGDLTIGAEVPGYIPYSDEVFNVYDFENNEIGHITIENSILTEVNCEIDEATYNVFIQSPQTVQEILYAEKPMAVLDDKMGDELRVEGVTFAKSTKGFFTRAAVKILSWFS